jgi:hypothetical protein
MGERPVTIRKDFCVIKLYDVANFLRADAQGIWKLMFSAPFDNEDSINLIQEWLPEAVRDAEACKAARELELQSAKYNFVRKESEKAAMGTGYWEKQVADIRKALKRKQNKGNEQMLAALEKAVEHKDRPKHAKTEVRLAELRLKSAITTLDRAVKLQTMFNKMAEKAKI